MALVSGSFIIATSATGASGATTVPPPTTTTTTPACAIAHDDPWPAYTQGIPTNIDPNTAAGVYMWHDVNGWHIRVTHKSDSLRTFSGQLISQGTFGNVTAVHLEDGDAFAVSPNKHTISFLFTNYGHIDGLNFFTHCAPSVMFAFQSDGVTVPPAKIAIGHAGTHPATDPFTIYRVLPPPPTTTTSSTTTSSTTTTIHT